MIRWTMRNEKKSERMLAAQRPWRYMLVYWSIGCWVGYAYDYFLMCSLPNPTSAVAMAWLVTIFCQLRLNTRFCRYNRQLDRALLVVFALSNGTAETMLFLASYDGCKIVAAMMRSCPHVVQMAFGFLGFSIYSALIHDMFWLKMVFPPHIKPDAKPFLSHGLPFLLFVSACWFYVYEVYGDVLSVIILHAIVDAMAGYQFAFPTTKLSLKEQ
jgi:hypothetical protein